MYVGSWGLGAEDGAVGESAEAARAYLRARWADFLTLGPRIQDLQHEAALLAQRCTERGDPACAQQAKDSIARLGEQRQAYSWAIDAYHLERVGEYLGLGAVPVVPVAALTALALVVVWAFRAYEAEAEKLRLIEAGLLTPEQAAALDAGPAPDILFSGATDLARLALWGGAIWLAFQLLARLPRTRARRNPPLEVWRANPPAFGEEVYEVLYRHGEDGEHYVHEFGPDVRMEAQPDGSVSLFHAAGEPLWDDFEV